MFKQLFKAGILSAGLVLAPLGATSAAALPVAKGPAANSQTDNLVLARQGGGRGFGGGGGGGRMMGGGGGGGKFMGGGGRGFSGGSFGGSRSFSRGRMGGAPRAFRHGGSGRHVHGGRHWHGGKGHRHRRHRHFYGGYYPYYGAAYYGGYSGDCSWLRRRAIRSGSSYWWRRYEACVDGY